MLFRFTSQSKPMKPLIHVLFHVLLATLIACGIAACGQKGGLTRPDQTGSTQQFSQT
jgi:predicted small lipoprotein YifL